MDELTQHPERLPDCDCRECAIHERNWLRTEIERLEADLDFARSALEGVKGWDIAAAKNPARPVLLALPHAIRALVEAALTPNAALSCSRPKE